MIYFDTHRASLLLRPQSEEDPETVPSPMPGTPGVVGTTIWPGDCGRRPTPDNWDTCLLVDSALGGHCRQRGGAASFCEAEDGVREECNSRDGRGWREMPAEARSCRPFVPQSGV